MGIFGDIGSFLGFGEEEKEVVAPQAPVRQYTAEEQELVRQMQAQASGTAPSLAEALGLKERDRAYRDTMSIASMSRGGSNPFALRSAMTRGGLAQQEIGQNEAIGKIKERSDAQNVLAGMYAGDAQRVSDFQRQQLVSATAQYEQDKKREYQIFSDLASGGAKAAAAALSDENVKENVSSGSAETYNFLDHLASKKYNYKDPAMGEGTFVSPMAQDIEQTAMGSSMVKDTPAGKMVDYGHGFGAILAAQADLHSRLKALEGGKKNG